MAAPLGELARAGTGTLEGGGAKETPPAEPVKGDSLKRVDWMREAPPLGGRGGGGGGPGGRGGGPRGGGRTSEMAGDGGEDGGCGGDDSDGTRTADDGELVTSSVANSGVPMLQSVAPASAVRRVTCWRSVLKAFAIKEGAATIDERTPIDELPTTSSSSPSPPLPLPPPPELAVSPSPGLAHPPGACCSLTAGTGGGDGGRGGGRAGWRAGGGGGTRGVRVSVPGGCGTER